MIYGHGNQLSLYHGKILADFSSNIICDGTPEKLINYLSKNLSSISNYPEPNAKSLQLSIATYHGLDNEYVNVTNGSAEAFYLLAHLFKGKSSIIFYPSFSEYEDACKLYDHSIEYICNSVPLSEISCKADLVWIGNPNNPDGKIIRRDEIIRFCENHKNTFIIIDEAYAELCMGFDSGVSLLSEYDNVIVVRSLTKTFAIPGLRLGYILAQEKLLKKLNSVCIPWSVNSIAILAGKFIMHNYNELLPDIKKLMEHSLQLQFKVNQLEYLKVLSSGCNFFLAELLKGSAEHLKDYLISEYGILIRNASNFRGLNERFFRIAVQKPTYNNLLFDALIEWGKQL